MPSFSRAQANDSLAVVVVERFQCFGDNPNSFKVICWLCHSRPPFVVVDGSSSTGESVDESQLGAKNAADEDILGDEPKGWRQVSAEKLRRLLGSIPS